IGLADPGSGRTAFGRGHGRCGVRVEGTDPAWTRGRSDLAQDDYYYEIQLTNKQLVFYFLAGATGLILSFLAGVMVGRGVDQTAGEVQAARAVPVQEEKVVAEEAPKPAPPAAQDLTYAQRLE